jgi:TRAP-type C4-dicarboxylate transport system permease small subunit
MESPQPGGKLEKGVHWTSIAFNYIGILALFLMMLLVAIDVILRYVFNSPYTGSYDFIEMMMAVLVFCGLAYCTYEEGHVRVDVILSRLSARNRGILSVIAYIPSVLIVGLITWRLGDRVWNIFKSPPGPTTLTLQIPHWPFIILATLGSFLFFLELAVYLVRSVKSLRK